MKKNKDNNKNYIHSANYTKKTNIISCKNKMRTSNYYFENYID